jgi:hypothetical protein
MKKYVAYIGIDFGTSGTTFSYWFPTSNLEQGSISVKKWPKVGTSNKMETEIIVDENFGEILAFGNKECSGYVKNPKKKFLYFSNVKMYLYNNKMEITDNYSNKKYSLIKVISKFLEKMRDEAIELIKSEKASLREKSLEQLLDSIRWIITVPAIWSEQNKTCMIEASKLAKLIKDKDDISNFFALEPEAAACFYSMSDKAEEKILDNPYIICDIGGGTTDITTHERIKDEEGKYNINELYPPSGGAHGSREINKYILEEILIKKIFTQEAYDKMQEKMKQEGEDSDNLKEGMISLNHDINEFKEFFELGKIDERHKIKLDIFKFGFEDEPNIEELVKNYNDNAKEDWKIVIKSKKYWILEFPFKIIKDLFQELIVDKAVDYINKIINYLKNRKKDKKEIKTVILAGGTADNLSIFELFKTALPNLTVVRCNEPEIAVVKGAIHFAKNPFTISKRIARFSLGIKSVDSWGERYEKIPGAIKIGDEKNNLWFCQNVFSVYYKKNRPINTNAEGKKFIFDMNSNQASIEFYKSDFDGPIYVVGQKDENGKELTEKFGSLEFTVEDFDKKETGVEIEIKLGGTSISAKVKYLKTGKEKIQTFNFN